MKTALVLGAGGFIGNHLVSSLKKEGFWVKAADIKEPDFSKSEADMFVLGDLRNQDDVEKIVNRPFDEVYQLAADMGGMGYISGDNNASILTNSALINLNVLRQAERVGIKGIFFSSSACIYPEHNQLNPNNFTCEESTAYPAAPDTEYGWEKLFSERLYLAYNYNYGMKNKVARYHNIFGPLGTYEGGKEKAPAALCRKIAEATDSIEIWGDGEQLRSFLYIDECIKFTKEFYREPTFFEPINIGSTHTVSINSLATIIMRIAGKEHLNKIHVPGPTGVQARTSNNDLIKRILGKAPDEDLVSGLESTYKWIKGRVNDK